MATKYTVSILLKGVDSVSKPSSDASKGLRKLLGPIKDVGNAFKKMYSSWSRLFMRMGLGLGALWGTVTGLTYKFTSLGDNIAKTADKLGISTDQLQEWRYAAELAGIEERTFDMALQRFLRRLGEAKVGQGELVKGLQQLRIHLKKSDGSYKTSEELFLEYMDALNGVEDNTTRLALAMKAFDSEGVKMVNMAKGGRKEILRLGKELRDMGGIIDEETLRNSEEFKNMMTKITVSAKGMAFKVVGGFLPDILRKMGEVTTWIKEHQSEITTILKRGIERLRGIASGFWKTLKRSIKTVTEFVEPLTNWLGLTKDLNDEGERSENIGKNIAKILVFIIGLKFGVMLASLITPIVQLGTATFKLAKAVGLFNLALWANPITWAIGLLVGLLALIVAIGTNFMGLGDRFKRGVNKVVGWIIKLTDWFGTLAEGAFNLGKDFVLYLWEGIKSVWNTLTGWISNAWQGVLGMVGLGGGPTAAGGGGGAALAGAAGTRPGTFQGNLRVEFTNAPAGTRIAGYAQEGSADFGVDTGLSMAMT